MTVLSYLYSNLYGVQVLTQSKHLLLRTVSPDALVRLGHTQLSGEEQQQLHKIYFDEQHHSSIEDFLVHHLQQCEGGGVLMQVVMQDGDIYTFVLHILFAIASGPNNLFFILQVATATIDVRSCNL